MERQLIAYHIFHLWGAPARHAHVPLPASCEQLRKRTGDRVIDSSCLALPSSFDLSTTTNEQCPSWGSEDNESRTEATILVGHPQDD